MHALSAVLVFGLGAATLLLHDKHFIQLKPTILFWVAGLAFLASFWIGKQTLTERLFSAALQGQVRVPESLWRRMNTLWVVFYGLLGEDTIANVPALVEGGVIGFKLYMGNTFGKIPSPSTGAMLEAFEVVAPTGKRVSLHAV